MRRFVCSGCGHAWYSAAKVDEPCEVCDGKLKEEAGNGGGEAGRRTELPRGVAAVALGGGGTVFAQPGGAQGMRPGAGRPVSPRVPQQAACLRLGGE